MAREREEKEERDDARMIDGENRPDQSLWLRTGEDISSRRRCRDCTFGASRSRTPGARGNPRVQGRSLRHAISVILPPVTCPPPGDPRGILSCGGRDRTRTLSPICGPTWNITLVLRRSIPGPSGRDSSDSCRTRILVRYHVCLNDSFRLRLSDCRVRV